MASVVRVVDFPRAATRAPCGSTRAASTSGCSATSRRRRATPARPRPRHAAERAAHVRRGRGRRFRRATRRGFASTATRGHMTSSSARSRARRSRYRLGPFGVAAAWSRAGRAGREARARRERRGEPDDDAGGGSARERPPRWGSGRRARARVLPTSEDSSAARPISAKSAPSARPDTRTAPRTASFGAGFERAPPPPRPRRCRRSRA